MQGGQPGRALEPLQTLFRVGTAAGLTDAQLLERFVKGQSDDAEAAFAALVIRHGPMVRRVCGSLLADPNDADEVFQVIFLILARKARTIRRPALLANWLYGTAYRTAQTLKRQATRRARIEAREAAMATTRHATGQRPIDQAILQQEAALIVHEELARLPGSFRAAVVLCDLEDHSHDEAAHLLGCSDRTIRRRLDRARNLLRERLTRRGLAPTSSLVTAALRPELASTAIPPATVHNLARAATTFAAGNATAGTLPVATLALAEGVIRTMFWTKLKMVGIVSSVSLAAGISAGTGISLGIAAQDVPKPAERQAQPKPISEPKLPSPAEQYQALLKEHETASAAYRKLGEGLNTQAELEAAYKDKPRPEKSFYPRFMKLAERYPSDPVAVDALVWIVGRTMLYSEGYDAASARIVGRAMEILARDHLANPKLGPVCLTLVNYPSPRRDWFLRKLAEESPDRTVRGRAVLALAIYLGKKGGFVRDLKNADNKFETDLLKLMYHPDYLAELRAAGPEPMLRECDKLFARVFEEYADISYVPPYESPMRETLADVAHRERRPGSVDNLAEQFRTLDDAFRAEIKAAEQAENEARTKLGKGQPDGSTINAFVAAFPKWQDYGTKMWELAQRSPHQQAALDALIWLVENGPHFFDAKARRDHEMSMAVDVLIRDHLNTIGAHLTDTKVARALNMGEQLPSPYRERLLRALFEKGRDRETRGRMGLALGRYLKAEAECIERLTRPDAEARQPWDLLFLDTEFAAKLRKLDRAAIAQAADDIFARVISDYGDIFYWNGSVKTKETLGEVAAREQFALRNVSVGKQAPEITGVDLDGKPMTLSEFRGKVVLLDFDYHGGKDLYSRLRSTLDRLLGRPFVILGVMNLNHREEIKQAVARGDMPWRSWSDGDKPDGPGPITTRWNVHGFPTFIVIDHRGVIRSNGDLHPFDRAFDSMMDSLVKQAEADLPKR